MEKVHPGRGGGFLAPEIIVRIYRYFHKNLKAPAELCISFSKSPNIYLFLQEGKCQSVNVNFTDLWESHFLKNE